MQYIRILCCILFCASGVPAFADERPVITIAADNWCPINCAPPEAKLGVGIDLAKAIYEPLGFEIRYQVMPWSEALRKVRAGEIDAVVGADRTDDPTLVFPAKPIIGTSDDFYVLKGNAWKFQGVHTLKGKKLGMIKDYGYGTAVNEYVRSNPGSYDMIQQAGGGNALEENIRKLRAGKIDVLVETRPVMEYTMARLELGDEHIIRAGGVAETPVYLAFSPALSKSRMLADSFDNGIRRLRESGQLEAFYHNYGLTYP